jgi:hypothetical protein
VTAIPLGSGGKAPKREDFNGALNMLSNIAFYAQKGWVFQWDSGQTYYAGCIVRYSGNLYQCISDVTSTTKPNSDTTHWSKYNISPGVTYAPLNSPAFTGTPTAPTPTSGDDSTKIATTAFVKAAISGGGGDPVVDTYVNTSTGDWYRVFKSGWVEQGGRTQPAPNTVTITFLKPYANTTYNVSLTKIRPSQTGGGGSDLLPAINGSRNTTGFTITQQGSSGSTVYGHYTLWSAQGQGVAPA